PSSFRNISDALAGDQMRSRSGHDVSVDLDLALKRGNVTGERANQRRFAHSIASHQADGFAGAYGKIDTVKNMARAVEGMERVGVNDRIFCHSASSPPPR